MSGYTQLTQGQRYQMEALHKAGHTQRPCQSLKYYYEIKSEMAVRSIGLPHNYQIASLRLKRVG